MTTAIASAMLNRSPLIFLSAQTESDDIFYNLSHQCVNQESILEPITKWSYQLRNPEELHWALNEAFRRVLTPPFGPAHISIPVDFFKKKTRLKKRSLAERKDRKLNKKLDPVKLRRIHDLLQRASHPVCLLSSEAIRFGHASLIKDFCERWQIPVIVAANAKGFLSDDHHLNYGSVSPYMEGILGYEALRDIFHTVDLVLCVAYQYVDDVLPRMWERGPQKKIVNIAHYPIKGIEKKFRPDVEIIGDIGKVLQGLSKLGVSTKKVVGIDRLKKRYRDIIQNENKENRCLTPIQVINIVNKFLGDGIFVTDIGYYRHLAILFSKPSGTRQFFTDTGLSSFGTGLPSAMGASFLFPEKRIFLICGDGGFHSGNCDLETAVRYNLSITIMVLNNSAYELIRLYQRRFNKRTNESIVKLGEVDFVKLAEANGCEAIRASSRGQLEKALLKGDRKGPLLIEIPSEFSDDAFRISF